MLIRRITSGIHSSCKNLYFYVALVICFIESYFLPFYIKDDMLKGVLNIIIPASSGLIALCVAIVVLLLNIINTFLNVKKLETGEKLTYENFIDSLQEELFPHDTATTFAKAITTVSFSALITLIFSISFYGMILIFPGDISKVFLLIPQFTMLFSLFNLIIAFYHMFN